MQQAAAKAGFKLQSASAFRDFSRQQLIWNEKFTGKRAVLDTQSVPLDISLLNEGELCEAILHWSALPGASRHHWGTEIDIYDPFRLPSGQSLQLEPWEYETGGYFSELNQWMSDNMAMYDFYRPFTAKNAGYKLIRVGDHVEASSGCYTAMAILPLSAQAKLLCDRAEQLLARDLFWRNDLDEFNFNINNEQKLTDEDWLELVGFAFYSRALTSSSASIQRFLAESEESLMSLRLYFQQKLPLTEICQGLKLTGHKQWLKQARGEVREIIQRNHPELVIKIEQEFSAFYP